MTDLFNPFPVELLGALEHLSGVIDIYWSVVTCIGNSWPRIFKFDEFLLYFYIAKFCAEESSKQKNPKISTDQKSNTEIEVRRLYLAPILHLFYPIRDMASFRCGNILLIGDLKNTKKAYQNIRGQQVVRPILFSLEKFNQIDSYLPHRIYGQFLVW